MIGLDPKSILWWENNWWTKPQYSKYGHRLKSIGLLKSIFNKEWCERYYEKCISDAEKNIKALDLASNPLALFYVENFKKATSKIEKYLCAFPLIKNKHPLFEHQFGEGIYFLDSLLVLSESIRSVRRHKNYNEIKKRLRNRNLYYGALAEICFAKLLKDKGIRLRAKGQSLNPKRNYDYACSFKGHKLGIEITKMNNIWRRDALDPTINYLYYVLVMQGGLKLKNFIVYIDNIEASNNIKKIIEEIKMLECKILDGKLPRCGVQKICECGDLVYDQRELRNSINGKFVSQRYDNKLEIEKIGKKIEEKRDQFPKRRDSILVVFVPHSFVHKGKLCAPLFPNSLKIIGVLAVSQYYDPEKGIKNKMTFIKNSNYKRKNLILEKICAV